MKKIVKNETTNRLYPFRLKVAFIEIDRYVKNLGDFSVVNTWAQKYLFTKSVSNLVNKDEFFRKYMYLIQCYILIRAKFSSDGVLARLDFSFTGGKKMGFEGG